VGKEFCVWRQEEGLEYYGRGSYSKQNLTGTKLLHAIKGNIAKSIKAKNSIKKIIIFFFDVLRCRTERLVCWEVFVHLSIFK
jgi:hypothetical protein